MQRILQGARRARRMKRMQKKEDKWTTWRGEKAAWQQQDIQMKKMEKGYIKDEAKSRREDWMLGPLAPNRNSGIHRNVFGTVDGSMANRPALPKDWTPKLPLGYKYIGDSYKGFKGTTMAGNVALDDRVCVVHGPERLVGLIGTVTEVDNQTGMLKLRDINVADLEVPLSSYLLSPNATQDIDTGVHQTGELPIPIESTRLVVDIPQEDPETGETQLLSFIVRHVHAGAPYTKQQTGSNRPAHTRYITGSETSSMNGSPIRIPWPEREDMDHMGLATDADTKSNRVEEDTWTPDFKYGPLTYRPKDFVDLPKLESAASAYEAGLPDENDKKKDINMQRAGLHGFMNEEKLLARKRRIANGIMNELVGHRPSKKRSLKLDFNELRATKVLEDARSIWWQERAKDLSKTPVQLAIRQEMGKRFRETQQQSTQQKKLIQLALKKKMENGAKTEDNDNNISVDGVTEDAQSIRDITGVEEAAPVKADEEHRSLNDTIKEVSSKTPVAKAGLDEAMERSKPYELFDSLPRAAPLKKLDVKLCRRLARDRQTQKEEARAKREKEERKKQQKTMMRKLVRMQDI